MIDQLINRVALAVVRALQAFFATFKGKPPVEGDIPEEDPQEDGSDLPQEEVDEDFLNKLASTLTGVDPLESRHITPFKYHMKRHFKDREDLTRTEIVENMLLSLDSISEEIQALVDCTIKCRIEHEEAGKFILLHGHIDWRVDKVHPDVYAISRDLLSDGFTFKADTKTFVITSRIKK